MKTHFTKNPKMTKKKRKKKNRKRKVSNSESGPRIYGVEGLLPLN